LGVSYLQPVTIKNFEVPASTTEARELFKTSEHLFATLQVDVTEVTVQNDKKYRSLKLDVRAVDGDTEDTVYGRMGLGLSLEINTLLNGNSVELEVVNNNAFAVTVSFSKLKLK